MPDLAKTYTVTQEQLTQISEALLDAESLMEIDGLVEDVRLVAMTKAREEVDSILYMVCELCGDMRLEEDLNEDLLCPPCEEREEKNESGI